LTAAEVAYQTAKGPKLSGRITVGVLEDFSARRLPHLLALFQQTYPDVDVEVISDLSTHLDGLISRKKLDLAILKRIHVPNTRSKNETSLFVEPLRWVAGNDGPPGRDASVPLVLFPDGCVYRQQIIRALTDIDAKPSAAEPHLTSANGVTARRFASKAAFAAAFCSCRRLGVHTTLRWREGVMCELVSVKNSLLTGK
jgi:DNA-binding transcriptional LysR family regulator